MIVDTHLHLIDRGALGYPWLAGVPALDDDFLYHRYALEARRAGITAALHMEVDVEPRQIEAETAYVEGLSRRPGNMLAGAIAACRPEEPGFPEYLERERANPFVKGLRRVLHVAPDELSEQRLFRENIRRLEGTGLTFDLCVLARQLPQAIALVDVAPGVNFVLDHCGNPDVAGQPDQPWREQMAQMARRENVTVKISGIVNHADPASWTVDTLRPYVEHAIHCFGWDRLIWGSDWPVCTLGGGLSTWVAATHALLAGCSDGERTKLLSANARRLWDLG